MTDHPDGSHGDADIKTIEAALDGVARVLTRVRLHDQLTAVAGVDIDRAGAALLYKLVVCGEELRLRDVAERLGVDAPVVTRKVQQLEAQGLLVRAADPDDGRAVRLRVTSNGRHVIERLLEARRTLYTNLLADWPSSDRAAFAQLLSRFADDLSKKVGVNRDR